MHPSRRKSILIGLAVFLAAAAAAPAADLPRFGASERSLTLPPELGEIRGLAFDDVSPQAPRLFVLDASGRVHIFRAPVRPDADPEPLEVLPAPARKDKAAWKGLRGLAYTRVNDQDLFYALSWSKAKGATPSELVRCAAGAAAADTVDLTLYPYKIGEREVLGLTADSGEILVAFDGSNYKERSLRAQRGLIRLKWSKADPARLDFVRHLPDSGHLPARGLAFMTLDGVRYLWGTVGEDFLYCAEALAGRGLFHFARPRSGQDSRLGWGLAFGAGSLWVPEQAGGRGRIHRVNVTRNLDAPVEGGRALRHLIMEITTEPEGAEAKPGKVFHNYSRPYAYAQLGNQGAWPETEKAGDASGAGNASVRAITMDPAGDAASRQFMSVVEYAEAPARAYTSRYEIDMWTNTSRTFVYPHRVDLDRRALQGTNYLEDDPVLYNLQARRTDEEFIDRVRGHIAAKYGVPADMANPYWAARNIVEYIQDSYYYPSPAKRVSASVDYGRSHYDANPGNLKIELSNRPYDKTQIIACSGTSVMVAGAMRFLGFPTRWLGTGTPVGPDAWDADKDGFLTESETAGVSNGHRYDQVWLGSHYGWVCFDATPTLPDDLDFDPAPPLQTQWRYMNRTAAGHLKDQRIVFNVGSKLIPQLYRDFEYDEELDVINNCGGAQRYNLQGKFDKPEAWKLAEHRISVRNVCFVDGVRVEGAGTARGVAWTLRGAWAKDPGARLEVVLQRVDPEGGRPRDLAVLRGDLKAESGRAEVDLGGFHGAGLRIAVRKAGDPETGGASAALSLD